MSRSAAKERTAAGALDAGYLRGLFHGAGLAVIACDRAGQVMACNPAACKLFPAADEVLGRAHVSALFPAEDRQHVEELVEGCASALEPREYLTQLGYDETGPREYAIMCTPVVEVNGSLRGVSLWLRDITKRRRLLRELKRNERMTYLGKLAGAVAHHYNNLLCSIATSLEYAMNMNTMSAMRRAAQRTAEAVGRTANVTRQLLAFAQADHRDVAAADLAETVLAYFETNAARFQRRHVETVLDCRPIPPLSLPQEQLLIVLAHLVNNALDAMPTGGTLWVSLVALGPEVVCLSITDSGAGISADDMEHLFEPFYTTKGVLTMGQSINAGLGLAVVHGLVHEMRGAITAANVPGRGARFDIVLPVDQSEEKLASP